MLNQFKHKILRIYNMEQPADITEQDITDFMEEQPQELADANVGDCRQQPQPQEPTKHKLTTKEKYNTDPEYKEKIMKSVLNWRNENREKYLQYQKLYNIVNKDRIRERKLKTSKEYYEQNKERLREKARIRSRERYARQKAEKLAKRKASITNS